LVEAARFMSKAEDREVDVNFGEVSHLRENIR
jgi:hypothetical protein